VREESLIGRVPLRETRKGRLAVIAALDAKGVFTPRSSRQVAAYLNVSRATVYADLNAVRESETPAQQEPVTRLLDISSDSLDSVSTRCGG
jgi:hypothetical protein